MFLQSEHTLLKQSAPYHINTRANCYSTEGWNSTRAWDHFGQVHAQVWITTMTISNLTSYFLQLHTGLPSKYVATRQIPPHCWHPCVRNFSEKIVSRHWSAILTLQAPVMYKTFMGRGRQKRDQGESWDWMESVQHINHHSLVMDNPQTDPA